MVIFSLTTTINCHNEIVLIYIRTHHLLFVAVLFLCDLATRELSSPFSVQLLVAAFYLTFTSNMLLCTCCVPNAQCVSVQFCQAESTWEYLLQFWLSTFGEVILSIWDVIFNSTVSEFFKGINVWYFDIDIWKGVLHNVLHNVYYAFNTQNIFYHSYN